MVKKQVNGVDETGFYEDPFEEKAKFGRINCTLQGTSGCRLISTRLLVGLNGANGKRNHYLPEVRIVSD